VAKSRERQMVLDLGQNRRQFNVKTVGYLVTKGVILILSGLRLREE
jgi:hypothetical protein